MFWVILFAIVFIVVLIKMGIFRKEGKCAHCGKTLNGTEQTVFGIGEGKFILCQDCLEKINPKVARYAKSHWSYQKYLDYLKWDEETKEERSQFTPTDEYGYSTKLRIDKDRCLFSLGNGTNDPVFRFEDIMYDDIDFKPEKVKDGMFGSKVKGNEYVAIQLLAPDVYLEEVVCYGASYRLREKGFIKKKYEYALSDELLEIIRVFTICKYLAANRQSEREAGQTRAQDIDEIQKAMALFMLDSTDEITMDNLKKQRNALIKTFHPDHNESNVAYSQKINAAYELLSSIAKQ